MEDLIYQTDPVLKTPSTWRNKSWTDSIDGYLREAQQLARCVELNHYYLENDYKWEANINVEVVLSPAGIKSVWEKACRKLKALGVRALWVREPSKKNHCNYHLLVQDNISEKELAAAVEKAMPDRADIPWHKHIDKINTTYYHFTRYILKAKVNGLWKGKTVEDKWKYKRLLFKKNLSIKKVGTIGKFWVKPKKVLWQQVVDLEKRIGEGLEQPGMEELVVHVSELTGEPIKHVERTLGYYSDEATIKDWIETIACP